MSHSTLGMASVHATLTTGSAYMVIGLGLVVVSALVYHGLELVRPFAGAFEAVTKPVGALLERLRGYSLFAAIGAGLVLALFVYAYYLKTAGTVLAKYRPPVCAEVLDRNQLVLDYACPSMKGVRVWRPLSSIDRNLPLLVVMLEDDKFYAHGGVDLDEMVNALSKDLEKGKLARGGSTITQQLAKNLFLTKEKSLFRKATEIPLSLRLEKELSKDQILELYLNTIEWGPGIYGAEAASRVYFDHAAATLTPEEAWLLALMIPNPKELNLWLHPNALKSILKRGKHLSERLYSEHKLSKEGATEAYDKFERFITEWMTHPPRERFGSRTYPALTEPLLDGVAARPGLGALDWIQKSAGDQKKAAAPQLFTTLDRILQEELWSESGLGGAYPSDQILVVSLQDEARAVLPLPAEHAAAAEKIKAWAERQGLTSQIFSVKRTPPLKLLR